MVIFNAACSATACRVFEDSYKEQKIRKNATNIRVAFTFLTIWNYNLNQDQSNAIYLFNANLLMPYEMDAYRFLYVLMILNLAAQEKLPAPGKVPPTLYGFKRLNQDKEQNFFIVTRDADKLKQFLSEKNLHQNIISDYRNSNLFVIRTTGELLTQSSFLHP